MFCGRRVVLLLAFAAHGVNGLCPEGLDNATCASERAALDELYHATGGPNWEFTDAYSAKFGWKWLNESVSYCDWVGVECKVLRAGRFFRTSVDINQVGSIKLSVLRAGTLPQWNGTNNGSLSQLQKLELQLHVAVPVGLQRDNASLSGTLPSTWAKTLPSVETVLLAKNGITGTLPVEWSRMSLLTDLRVHGNNISGILPPQWANMSTLEKLHLDGNALSGSLPRDWGNLSTLKDLRLTRNRLTGPLPGPAWGNMSKLEYLYLDNNDIRSPLPPAWVAMSRLQYLFLHNNKGLTGALPSTWGGMSNLKYLRLNGTGVSGLLPASWAGMSKLEYLYLDNNKGLSGQLPSAWGKMTKLKDLHLSDCQFIGSLPPQWASMSSLEELYVNNNKRLTGSLPMQWVGTPKSVDLHLNDANASRNASPDSMLNDNAPNKNEPLSPLTCTGGGMSKLQKLHVNNNFLDGSLPHQWGCMSSMYELHLNDNELSGILPSHWSHMSALKYVHASRNKFSGTLPTNWGALSSLDWLDLNHNQLSGLLPNQWASLSSLISLDVGWNKLSGPLPPSWADSPILSELRFVFLNNNRFSGNISRWWPSSENKTKVIDTSSSGRKIKVFDARHNYFEGHVPWELLSSSAICILLLSDNQLHGYLTPLSSNFFEPVCSMSNEKSWKMVSPFRPALLLQDNRLSCKLPDRPAGTRNKFTSKEALEKCLEEHKSSALTTDVVEWKEQCHRLFADSDALITNPAMVLSGNMFDQPLPHWGILHDPMWDEVPFLAFTPGGSMASILPPLPGNGTNVNLRTFEGFAETTVALVGGAVLLATARVSLSCKRCDFIRIHSRQRVELNRRLSRTYSLSLRWLVALSLLLVVHLAAYLTGTHRFKCGNPLLKTTAAYLPGDSAQALATVIGTLLVMLSSVVFLARLDRVVREEQNLPEATLERDHPSFNDDDSDDSETYGNNQCPRLAKAGWALAWLAGALVMSVPTALYALSTAIPVQGATLQALLSLFTVGAPFYLTLINSLAVPWLAKESSRRIQVPTSWLLLTSRLLSTWVVPGLVVIFLDNSCGQHWVTFWDMCGSDENIKQMDVNGPNQAQFSRTDYWCSQDDSCGLHTTNTSYVDARSEICLIGNNAITGKPYQRTNSPQCTRAVVAALAPLLISKMVIAALALPAITVLKWRFMPRGIWARLRCRSNAPLETDIALDDVTAQALTWLDIAIVFTPQIPLLGPLVLVALWWQRWSTRVGLERLGKRETRWRKSVPAVWSVALSIVAQQVLNVFLYMDMIVLDRPGDAAEGTIRPVTWATAVLAGVGLAISWVLRGRILPWRCRRGCCAGHAVQRRPLAKSEVELSVGSCSTPLSTSTDHHDELKAGDGSRSMTGGEGRQLVARPESRWKSRRTRLQWLRPPSAARSQEAPEGAATSGSEVDGDQKVEFYRV